MNSCHHYRWHIKQLVRHYRFLYISYEVKIQTASTVPLWAYLNQAPIELHIRLGIPRHQSCHSDNSPDSRAFQAARMHNWIPNTASPYLHHQPALLQPALNQPTPPVPTIYSFPPLLHLLLDYDGKNHHPIRDTTNPEPRKATQSFSSRGSTERSKL